MGPRGVWAQAPFSKAEYFACLKVSAVYKFAHRRPEYAKNSVGLLHYRC